MEADCATRLGSTASFPHTDQTEAVTARLNAFVGF
jgi:hypothetical protein